jgi:hypothetical protein
MNGQDLLQPRARTRPQLDRIPLPGEEWRHVKTMKKYRIVGFAVDEATKGTLVLYTQADGGSSFVWSRPLDVFLWKPDDVAPYVLPRFVPAELAPVRP